MKANRWLAVVGALVALGVSGIAEEEVGEKVMPKWREVDVCADYQCFVKNWDAAKEPVLVRWIRSVDDWNATMGAAAKGLANGDEAKKPLVPAKELFARHSVLVIAWLTDFDGGHIAVENVEVEAGVATVSVHRHEEGEKQTFTRKEVLAVMLPAKGIESVKVLENGDPVGNP